MSVLQFESHLRCSKRVRTYGHASAAGTPSPGLFPPPCRRVQFKVLTIHPSDVAALKKGLFEENGRVCIVHYNQVLRNANEHDRGGSHVDANRVRPGECGRRQRGGRVTDCSAGGFGWSFFVMISFIHTCV